MTGTLKGPQTASGCLTCRSCSRGCAVCGVSHFRNSDKKKNQQSKTTTELTKQKQQAPPPQARRRKMDLQTHGSILRFGTMKFVKVLFWLLCCHHLLLLNHHHRHDYYYQILPVCAAQSCPLQIYAFATQTECANAAASLTGTSGGSSSSSLSYTTSFSSSTTITTTTSPGAVGLLYADDTCRATHISQYNPNESPSSTLLLPGNYVAKCVSDTAVEMYQSGCLQSNCLTILGTASTPSFHCQQDATAVSSFYSRLQPQPVYVVQSPTSPFPSCMILSGSSSANSTLNKSVTFFILGNCSDPACGVSTSSTSNSSGNSPSTFSPVTSPSSAAPSPASTNAGATASPVQVPQPSTAFPTPQVTSAPSSSASLSTTTAPHLKPTVSPTQRPSTATTRATVKPSTPTSPNTPPAAAPNHSNTTGGNHINTGTPTGAPFSAAASTGSSSNNSSKPSIPLGAILGGVLGGLAAFALILAVGFHMGSQNNSNQSNASAAGSGGLSKASLEENFSKEGASAAHTSWTQTDPRSPSTFATSTPGSGGAAMVTAHAMPNGNGTQTYGMEGASHPHINDVEGLHGLSASYLQHTPTPVVFKEDSDEVSTLGTPIGLAFVDETTATSALLEEDYGRGKCPAGSIVSTDDDLFTTDEKVFELIVPPGKLGMVIDDPNGYPQVSAIKPDSILRGQVQAGDRLLAVDDMDVSNLTCLETSNIIHRACEKKRRLCFSRGTIALAGRET